ncbi:MAG: alpha-2-macroglobulin family protein [Anaerolineae bacterium]
MTLRGWYRACVSRIVFFANHSNSNAKGVPTEDLIRRFQRGQPHATFDAALTPVRLPAAADRRIRDRLTVRTRHRPLWRLWQQRGLVVQALLALIAVTFLLTVAALGQGLVLEGWRRSGWATTLLGLLLIPLVVYLPFVPGLTSGLTRTLGNPALYAGPAGWMTGCAYKEAVKTVEITVPAEQVEVVVTSPPKVAEVTVEAPPATQAPAPTATPVPLPGEPFPLRQVFPETLYWNAKALTDENGRLALDLPLADNVTTWRLTALAATREGELGVATYDDVVFQDFFIDMDLPPTITQGKKVTATVALYNYLPQAQTVQVELPPGEWYDLVSAPQKTLALPPNDVASACPMRLPRK